VLSKQEKQQNTIFLVFGMARGSVVSSLRSR